MNTPEPLNREPRIVTSEGSAAPPVLVPPIDPLPVRPRPVAPPWLQAVQTNAAKLKPSLPQFITEASPASRTIPYFDGLDYGIGVDSPSGTAMNVAVTGEPSQIPNAGGAAVAYTMNELTSEEDLQTAMGISVEASGGVGLFSASASMDFCKSCELDSSSVFLLVSVKVTNAFTMIDAPGISQAAAALLASGNVTAFQDQYGDMFVRGLQTGGSFFGVIEIKTSSETDKQSLSTSISAAYGPFSASASFSDSFQQAVSNRNVKVTCYIEGGTIPTLPSTIEMLTTAVSTWPQTVAKNAVPYAALLDGYSVLPLPNPPNYINLQQQQDVLNQCSWWRNQDMQTLNDIAYIKNYPSEFVNPNATQLEQWQNDISADLNTIANAASNALNNPVQAELPTLLLPPPLQLPPRVAGALPPVTVPNIIGMYMRDIGQLLQSLGLIGNGTVVADPSPDQNQGGNAITQSPPAGTLVPDGSTVSFDIARDE